MQFVFAGGRTGDLARDIPGFLSWAELGVFEFLGVFFQAPAPYKHQVFEEGQFFFVHAVFVINAAVVVHESDYLGPQLGQLFYGINAHISRAGNNGRFPFDFIAARGQHVLRKIRHAVTRRLRAQQAAAPVGFFAGEGTRKIIGQLFILAEHIAYFARAAAQISGGNVGVIADVMVELIDKRVAEAHDFVVAFAARVKVRAAFSAAQRQRG